MNIDGKEYISLEEHNKGIEEIEKLHNSMIASKKIDVSKYFIIEPCNVMGIVPFNRDILIGEEYLEIESDNNGNPESIAGTYRLVSDKSRRLSVDGISTGKTITFSKSTYSLDFMRKAQSMARVLFTEKPSIYLKYDKDKSEFIENLPCLIAFDRLVFILAPLIEQEDSDDC